MKRVYALSLLVLNQYMIRAEKSPIHALFSFGKMIKVIKVNRNALRELSSFLEDGGKVQSYEVHAMLVARNFAVSEIKEQANQAANEALTIIGAYQPELIQFVNR